MVEDTGNFLYTSEPQHRSETRVIHEPETIDFWAKATDIHPSILLGISNLYDNGFYHLPLKQSGERIYIPEMTVPGLLTKLSEFVKERGMNQIRCIEDRQVSTTMEGKAGEMVTDISHVIQWKTRSGNTITIEDGIPTVEMQQVSQRYRKKHGIYNAPFHDDPALPLLRSCIVALREKKFDDTKISTILKLAPSSINACFSANG